MQTMLQLNQGNNKLLYLSMFLKSFLTHFEYLLMLEDPGDLCNPLFNLGQVLSKNLKITGRDFWVEL